VKTICFASGNQNKVDEIRHKLGTSILITGLKDLGFTNDIPETGNSLEENARIKARFVHEKFGINCFADDTGLMVDALGGAPGVFSARYAGDQRNSDDNISKLLSEMDSQDHRNAHFLTAICLILDNEEHMFFGNVHGTIQRERRGAQGFGYDSVFVPSLSSRTFAEMSLDEKNLLSHRAIAVAALKKFLEKGK